MKKLISLALAMILCLSLAACGGTSTSAPAPAPAEASASPATPAADAAPAPAADAAQTFTVGICQLAQHPALDAATRGFREALDEAMPGQIVFDEKNASGDISTCATIANGFVSGKVDLILANATPALQACAAATQTIPVLGTSITEFGTALDIPDFNGTVGGNVSGTSDLAPLDQQAAMFDELLPDAQKIGILYCSAEANSVYQATIVESELVKNGKTVTVYTFADSNDVATVTAQACGENDALYIPTDNTAASCAEAINNIAEPAGVPIIAGEENLCALCGVATLSIDFYELGRTTGAMAAKILKGESNVSEMPIEYFTNPVKKYNAELSASLNIAIPDSYEAIG